MNEGKTKLRNSRFSARCNRGIQLHAAASTSGDHDALPTISSKVHTGDILMTWEMLEEANTYLPTWCFLASRVRTLLRVIDANP